MKEQHPSIIDVLFNHPLVLKGIVILPQIPHNKEFVFIPKIEENYQVEDFSNLPLEKVMLFEDGTVSVEDYNKIGRIRKLLESWLIAFDDGSNLLDVYFEYVSFLVINDSRITPAMVSQKTKELFPTLTKTGPTHSQVEIKVDPRFYKCKDGKVFIPFSHLQALMTSFINRSSSELLNNILYSQETLWSEF